MDKVVIIVYIFAVLLPAVHAETTASPTIPPGDECAMWKSVTNNLTHNPGILMHCIDYSSCNGFDCSATYQYSGYVTSMQDFKLNFCFGLVLNQCDVPVNMITTIEVPDKNINFTQKYYDDETYQIPGATFDLGVGTADTFVDVTLEKSDDGKFITMGLLLKVRVKVPILPAQWPHELQRDVFPPTTIPIPPCNGKKAQAPPPRHNCVPPKEHSGVHPSSPTTSGPPKGHTEAPPTGRPPVKPPTGRPHKPVTTKPHTQQPPVIDVKGKKCTSSVDSGIIGQCGDNGKCSNGICGCMDGYAFNAITHSCTAQVNKLLGTGCELSLPECGYNAICKRKSQSSHSRGGVCACDVSNHFIKTSVNGGSACVPGDATETTKAPVVIPGTPQGKVDHGKDASDTPSTSNTVAIAASVGSIGFVLLVAGLVGAAIFIRRRRLRYRDHDVLLTTGDEGDDEPI